MGSSIMILKIIFALILTVPLFTCRPQGAAWCGFPCLATGPCAIPSPQPNICPPQPNICPPQPSICPPQPNIYPPPVNICPLQPNICPQPMNICPSNFCPDPCGCLGMAGQRVCLEPCQRMFMDPCHDHGRHRCSHHNSYQNQPAPCCCGQSPYPPPPPIYILGNLPNQSPTPTPHQPATPGPGQTQSTRSGPEQRPSSIQDNLIQNQNQLKSMNTLTSEENVRFRLSESTKRPKLFSTLFSIPGAMADSLLSGEVSI